MIVVEGGTYSSYLIRKGYEDLYDKRHRLDAASGHFDGISNALHAAALLIH